MVIIGCGALGTVIATFLTRDGVGKIRIVDRDFIGVHNFQRQVLFTEEDIANQLPKAVAAEQVTSCTGMTMNSIPGETPCFRCFFPVVPQPQDIATCVRSALLDRPPSLSGIMSPAKSARSSIRPLTSKCAPAAHKTIGTYPSGTIRISLGYFNTVEEIELMLQTVGKIARTPVSV